jgi:hypothetical protein
VRLPVEGRLRLNVRQTAPSLLAKQLALSIVANLQCDHMQRILAGTVYSHRQSRTLAWGATVLMGKPLVQRNSRFLVRQMGLMQDLKDVCQWTAAA